MGLRSVQRLGVGPEAQNKVRTVTSVLGGDGRVSFQNSNMPYRVVCRKHPKCHDRSVYQLKLMRCGGQNAPLLKGLDAKHGAARPAPTRSKRKGILQPKQRGRNRSGDKRRNSSRGIIGIQSYSGREGGVGQYLFFWFREDERQGCGSLIGR